MDQRIEASLADVLARRGRPWRACASPWCSSGCEGRTQGRPKAVVSRRPVRRRSRGRGDASAWRQCYATAAMLARFRQTATGLQCSLVKTRRIDGKVLHELVANLGSVPKSPSVADRIAFWRRVYETLAELANRIDAETQGRIISAVHSRIPLVTPNEQRALRARPRQSQKAPHLHGVDERPQSEAEGAKDEEHAELPEERMARAERGGNIEGGLSRPTTAEELRTVLVHLLHHTPFR
jgi:hypothetical protein